MSYLPTGSSNFKGKGIWADTAIKIYDSEIEVGIGAEKKTFVKAAATISAINGTLIANKWYAVRMKESDGVISVVLAGSAGSWTSWTGDPATANQLNCLAIYNHLYGYMRDSISSAPTVYYRILGVFQVTAAATGCSYIRTIYDLPKSFVYCTSSNAQTMNNNTTVIVNFETILIDINSEVTTGLNTWKFTAKKPGVFITNWKTLLASDAAWTAGDVYELSLFKSTAQIGFMQRDTAWATLNPAYVGCQGHFPIMLNTGEYLDARLRQVSGANINLLNDALHNHCEIVEV